MKIRKHADPLPRPEPVVLAPDITSEPITIESSTPTGRFRYRIVERVDILPWPGFPQRATQVLVFDQEFQKDDGETLWREVGEDEEPVAYSTSIEQVGAERLAQIECGQWFPERGVHVR